PAFFFLFLRHLFPFTLDVCLNLGHYHFSNNSGSMGAHFYVGCDKATIENCTFTNGYASTYGSVIVCPKKEALLIGCTISGNAAEEEGGGLYVGGEEVSIVGCKIYGNTTSGVADDITKKYESHLSLADDYAAMIELYKSDGVIPNRWTVDSRCVSGTDPYHADMVFTMTFADNEPTPVPPPVATSITLDKSELTLDVGETATLTATLHPEGRSSRIQWTSGDPSVASVTENGLITAHSAGTTSITATTSDGEASASCRVNVQAVPVTTYSINASASPEEGGTVSGGGQYEEGATVTVNAAPNEDFRFLAWTEADTQISTEANLTFTVSSDRTLIAVFELIPDNSFDPIPKPTYTINTSATVGGTVSGAGEYEEGSSVTLTATPESGYLFVGWTENGEQINTDESYTFTVD
ncbi:MAG: Ig-like domain-containing protein, partial [Oscillospiraceae bacterium]|nr:Ig-like domain-containing protein [Oscillospiraceae bacterium]